MCKPAHISLVIFYKPLSVSLWYCLLTVLDVSGTALAHNPMTETLCFVVQALFAAWFIVCGVFSAPLVFVVFFYLGLAFLLFFVMYVAWCRVHFGGDALGALVGRNTESYEKEAWAKEGVKEDGVKIHFTSI